MRAIGLKSRFIASAIIVIIGVAAASLGTAKAQQPQIPSSSAFLANPEQLLEQNPNGGSQLINAVQELALADPSTFKVLLGLTGKANELQKRAIGAGLAQATKIEVLTSQSLATDWQQQLAAIKDPIFQIAATNAFGDVQLGAVGGGAIGAAGSGLGGTGSGQGTGGGVQNLQEQTFSTTTNSVTTSTVSSSVSP
jgi:hypothetical protein